jgi:transcription elongation factor Elf1
MQSSRSNSSIYSFRSNASSEFRRTQKLKYHRRSASVMQQKPRKNIGVELDCKSCDTTASFQLTSQVTTITCSVCGESLGNFSVDYGRSTSIIKVGCSSKGCNHQNYQTTTVGAKDTLLRVSCLCGQYNPRLLLYDIRVDWEY